MPEAIFTDWRVNFSAPDAKADIGKRIRDSVKVFVDANDPQDRNTVRRRHVRENIHSTLGRRRRLGDSPTSSILPIRRVDSSIRDEPLPPSQPSGVEDKTS